MTDIVARARERRMVLRLLADLAAWLIAYGGMALLRLDASSVGVVWYKLLGVAVVTWAVYALVSIPVKLHQGRAKTASLEEMLLLGLCMVEAGFLVFVVNLFVIEVPRTVPAGATILALVIAAWVRATWRRFGERDDERSGRDEAEPVLIVGAGEAGRELVSSMLRDPARTWHPLGFLDDDPKKQHLRLRQVPVVGRTDQLAKVAADLGAEHVILALPSASPETIERLRLEAVRADLKTKILPASTQLLHEHVGIRDLRDIDLSDVLGRKQLSMDLDSISGYVAGKRVLVTGAGGSIGSELCRQLHRFGPAELMMLDRDESALHALELSIHGRALLDSDEVILCDIRDAAAIQRIFLERRPEVVFHAAALKHLPMLEQYPAEAVKTNVWGTRNVLDAADLVDVDHFVNISTDKAANPCCVLGYSKRIAECLTAERAELAAGTFVSVRFGNVLGSRGSVLTAFAKQIADGGPVTVTHPDVTRFFMTIEEACQLVVQAGAVGSPGEALVLDMGEPVSIDSVARRLIDQAGQPVRIDYTGLRDGEKMHEELFGDEETQDHRPAHPLVSHTDVPPVSNAEIEELPVTGDVVDMRAAMNALCHLAVERPAVELGDPVQPSLR